MTIKIILQIDGEDKAFWLAAPTEEELETLKDDITKVIDRY